MVSHDSTAQTEAAETTGTGEPTETNAADETCLRVPPAFDSLPASSELIYRVLADSEEPLTQREIAAQTAQPLRTIRHGLTRARNETDLIEKRPTTDGRFCGPSANRRCKRCVSGV